jgi:hypothetical protein
MKMRSHIIVSCNPISIPELASTTPVTPPRVNRNIKPKANKIGVLPQQNSP